MLEIDAIFFDVDGTLVDSRGDIVNAMNHALDIAGLARRDPDFIIGCVGTGVEALVRQVLGEKDMPHYEAVIAGFSSYYVSHPADKSTLYPHVREVLSHFGTKRKFVFTNRKLPFAAATLKGLGIDNYFEGIIAAADERCLKPSLCPLDEDPVASRIDRSRAIMVGDMNIDVQTGKQGGMYTCWVSYGFGKRAMVQPLAPDLMIDDLAELKELIR